MKTPSQTAGETAKETWRASDQTKAEFFGTLEFEGRDGELDYVEVLLIRGDRYIFGGACNAGFLESGYMKLESESGELGALKDELETYYRDGPQYVNRIICNERM